MKFFAAIILFVVSLGSFSAHALTKTEANMSPDESQVQISIGADIIVGTVTYNNGGTATLSGYNFPFMLYYGFDDHNAIGFEDGYSSAQSKNSFPGTVDTTNKSDGMNDLAINYFGNYDLMGNTLFLKIGAQIPTENNKENSATSESSSASGQPGVLLTAGMVFPTNMAVGNIGFYVKYSALFEGNVDFTDSNGYSQSGKVKDGGDMTIAAFIEGTNSLHPFVQISCDAPYDTTYTRNDGTSYKSGSVKNLTLTGSLTFEVVQGLEIIPALVYATATNKNQLDASAYDLYGLLVTARFTF